MLDQKPIDVQKERQNNNHDTEEDQGTTETEMILSKERRERQDASERDTGRLVVEGYIMEEQSLVGIITSASIEPNL